MLNSFQLSTTAGKNFQQLFCFQPLGLRFKTTYCLNHLKTAVFLKKHFCLRFSATFLFSTVAINPAIKSKKILNNQRTSCRNQKQIYSKSENKQLKEHFFQKNCFPVVESKKLFKNLNPVVDRKAFFINNCFPLVEANNFKILNSAIESKKLQKNLKGSGRKQNKFI